MPITASEPRPSLPPRPARPPATPERRPFRDNPRLILLGILLLIGALIAMVMLAERSRDLNPDFLTGVVLYALTAAVLTMLVALVFVLARNVIKLIVERRRGLPFSRFRAKLVLAMLGLTIIPSVLVSLVGGQLIRDSTEQWFSQPVDDVLNSANQIAGDYYRERGEIVESQALRIAQALPIAPLLAGDVEAVRRALEPELLHGSVALLEVYRLRADGPPVPVVALESPSLPRGHSRASADRLAARLASGSRDAHAQDALEAGGELVRAGALVRDGAGQPVGVVIASKNLEGELGRHLRRITEAYESYNQLRVLRWPLEGVYLSIFLMMTLMILVSATWMGLYLAKRITRPVQLLAAGAREIGAGRLDIRIEPETRDEFGSLVEAFNTMAGELAGSQRKLERSRLALEQKNLQLDERRRYIETVLERIATGVMSVGADGRLETVNAAALRLLDLEPGVVGTPSAEVFDREDLRAFEPLLRRARTGSEDPQAQEVALVREGRELHLAAAITPLLGEGGASDGLVLVFDDVTPLIRTQRVAAWRDVARRLAHEIKNPLTPIQLSAERMRRQFGSAPEPARALVEECTTTIVGEVESLKALVDEFAQFARMPAPRTVPSDINGVLGEALALYNGLFREIRIERRFAAGLPSVRVDVEQIRRVVINLVDNAVEALGGSAAAARPNGDPPRIIVGTMLDPVNGVVRITIIDNGPGIPPADREKLFMPYYSTKQRGSGLGLAIVRRIVAEHGGSIEVVDHEPSGSRFTIELPI
ncbi:MAG: HAMP domain-containing protein [Acidobacteria bacterium]|nr:HAMP domain-containing protein [Acidobacteriota bacterium]